MNRDDPPDDGADICQVCGRDVMKCSCKVCTRCAEAGNPECYFELASPRLYPKLQHLPSMHMTAEQWRSRFDIEERHRIIREVEHAWAKDMMDKYEVATAVPFCSCGCDPNDSPQTTETNGQEQQNND